MASVVAEARPAWLRSRRFDLTFVVGVAALALISGAVVVADPSLFDLVLVLDVWLLGFHHVIATFTRLCADGASIREHRALLTRLPLLVLAGVLVVGFGVGFWALTTTYLYWQWLHYTRQSWGIARVYESKAGLPLPEGQRLFKASFYLLPLWGILHRSHQNPDEFLGVEVWTLPVPGWAVTAIGIAALATIASVALLRVQAWRRGKLPVMQTVFLATHAAVFAVGYLLIADVDHGWLVINIWHNAQYIAFVWYFNNRRAAAVATPTFVQRMASRDRIISYLTLSILVATAVYMTLQFTLAVVVAPIIIYQTINFHHYIVDSRIWKVRKKPMQTALGLN